MFIPTHIHTHGLIHTAYQEEGRMKLIYTAYQEEGRTKLIYIYPAYQEEGRMKQVCSVPEETLRSHTTPDTAGTVRSLRAVQIPPCRGVDQ